MVPPIVNVALLDTVRLPPALARLAVKLARSNVPLLTERSPLMLTFILNVTTAVALEMIRLLKVVALVPLITWAVVPLKVTVAVPAVNAIVETLFVQFPFIAMLKLFAFSVPAVINRLLFIVIAAGKRRPLELLSVKLLKVLIPEKVCCPPVPLKTVVLLSV